ncbi:DUF1127 domain-containing protein [Pontibacterium sp. N1Y112]|uniref:DUF1127 domain-containing protein n=1 Tax=Pontibacterium sinense TaxID=2781979 RepID=A0A8J7FK37_9GAMM|nr:DUF1127 domain-containing protein [Pontibacterium sinense]MBE9399488.1 DUF1127 domain-containing protein [Pontibacterium sinense]
MNCENRYLRENNERTEDFQGIVQSWKQRLIHWRTNWRTRRELATLNHHQLKDIGISRVDALAESNKPFWKK